jgi:protein translocase SecG subunit
MFAVVLTIFILVEVVLIIVVLLQSSKGGGLAGAFGGGGSDSSFLGGRGTATLLSKLTGYLAGAFMVLALLLAILSSRGRGDEETSEGIIARRQQSGQMDVLNVEESGSILDQIQTEGFNLEGGEAEEGQADAGQAEEGAGKSTTDEAPAGR